MGSIRVGRHKAFRLILAYASVFFLGACTMSPLFVTTTTVTTASTNRPTETPTRVPSPTLTPTQTQTPAPQILTSQQLLENCEGLSRLGKEVTIDGYVFMPKYVVYGSGDWRGMSLSDFLTEDSQTLRVYVKLGEGPNTMDPIPEFFTEKDLVMRDYSGQVVHHGFLVSVTGLPRFNPDQADGKCTLWVDKIQSQMPPSVLVPLETNIKPLLERYTIGHGMQATVVERCAELGFQKQLVRIQVSIDFWNFPAECNMGICRIKIMDKTGSMFASFVQAEAPNCMVIDKTVWGPNSWKIFDSSGAEADKENLILEGVLYSDPQGCRISVYTVNGG